VTEFTNVTDVQTDGQTDTPHDGIARACIASGAKNEQQEKDDC